ncbi:uncharacterized protein C8Q71DRAFT_512030 [Rhodofomes roseus]|uniref:Uncharacterized protein n=1 Tax=Rhodofomes roseus TaxID=34475 RepID=A0ABQ8KNH9_9APHY|nr:uncharacterized protein C8Q71DRAFT_512030 [Rhodofomes roseus]KAH9839435.1 hypothetical protein C8Q71DRAFT_512030 [Rhodofomes roseus]
MHRFLAAQVSMTAAVGMGGRTVNRDSILGSDAADRLASGVDRWSRRRRSVRRTNIGWAGSRGRRADCGARLDRLLRPPSTDVDSDDLCSWRCSGKCNLRLAAACLRTGLRLSTTASETGCDALNSSICARTLKHAPLVLHPFRCRSLVCAERISSNPRPDDVLAAVIIFTARQAWTPGVSSQHVQDTKALGTSSHSTYCNPVAFPSSLLGLRILVSNGHGCIEFFVAPRYRCSYDPHRLWTVEAHVCTDTCILHARR